MSAELKPFESFTTTYYQKDGEAPSHRPEAVRKHNRVYSLRIPKVYSATK